MFEANIIGQELQKKALDRSIKNNQLPHFQVFIDEDGYGGLALGLYTAGQILDAPSLEKLRQHPDVHFLFPTIKNTTERKKKADDYLQEWLEFCTTPYASYTDWMEALEGGNKEGIIGKDEVVSLQEKIHLKSFLGKAKVVLLWGAERINEAAANKLLKSLEEPPANTYFIFITAAASKLLPTITSRAQTLTLSRLPDAMVSQQLRLKGIEIERIKPIVEAAQGSWSKAMRHIKHLHSDSVYEKLWVDGLRAAFRARQTKSVAQELMAWAETLAQQTRPQQLGFLDYGLELIRQAMLINFGAGKLSAFYSKIGFDINKLAPFIHSNNLNGIQDLIQKKHFHISRNANSKIQYTDMAIQLTRLLHSKEA